MIVHFINSSKAPSIGLNFKLVSSYSSCGIESITIPQPANKDAFSPFNNPQRSATANSPFPSSSIHQSVHHTTLCLTIQHHGSVSSLPNEVSRQEAVLDVILLPLLKDSHRLLPLQAYISELSFRC